MKTPNLPNSGFFSFEQSEELAQLGLTIQPSHFYFREKTTKLETIINRTNDPDGYYQPLGDLGVGVESAYAVAPAFGIIEVLEAMPAHIIYTIRRREGDVGTIHSCELRCTNRNFTDHGMRSTLQEAVFVPLRRFISEGLVNLADINLLLHNPISYE